MTSEGKLPDDLGQVLGLFRSIGTLRRPLVEHHSRSDIRLCHRAGRVDDGQTSCRVGGDRIAIRWLPVRVGGMRPQFECPHCCKGAYVLHRVDGVLQCRKCHGLAYESENENTKSCAFRRARTIRVRRGQLDGNLSLPSPRKQKWKHYRGYFDEASAAKQAEYEGLAVMAASPRINDPNVPSSASCSEVP